MKTSTFLDVNAANLIYEQGRRHEWWPFDTRADFDCFLRRHPLTLRGRGTHVIVGLDQSEGIVVREFESVTALANVTQEAFVVAYADLTERVIHEYVS